MMNLLEDEEEEEDEDLHIDSRYGNSPTEIEPLVIRGIWLFVLLKIEIQCLKKYLTSLWILQVYMDMKNLCCL